MRTAVIMILTLSALLGTSLPQLASTQPSVTDGIYALCNTATFTSNDTFAQNLNAVANSLIFNSSRVLYSLASSASGTPSNYVHAMYQCRGDVALSDCSTCVTNAFTVFRRAGNSSLCGSLARGVRVQYRGCFLRYESYVFSDALEISSPVSLTCSGSASESSRLYQQNLATALAKSVAAAPRHPLFGYNETHVGSGSNLAYGITQCLGFLNSSQCAACLSQVSNNSNICNGSVSGQVYFVDCYYLFGNTSLVFTYNNTSFPPPPFLPPSSQPPAAIIGSPLPEGGRTKNQRAAVIGIVVGSVGLLAIIAALALCFFKRRKKSRAEVHRERAKDTNEHLLPRYSAKKFSLKELQDATDNFNLAKKLGEGGFGPVYQGKLTNGREVAIKMLSSHSRQGKLEFVNEVNLMTTVQHRNLIQLIGYCEQDNKQLLVYEYLPNRSLDLCLFEAVKNISHLPFTHTQEVFPRTKGAPFPFAFPPGFLISRALCMEGNIYPDVDENTALDWRTRFDIIVGIARGLRYLHEDSPIRIIHRDIKASNILLDNNLDPKIADFGLARLFGDEASQLITRVVGTFGYLAPEYAIGGQLSEKADVYSFGLLVLEIVSGRRVMATNCEGDKKSLLEWTWALYEKHQQLQILDEKVQKAGMASDGKGSVHVSVEEVVRVVHVALLCTQLQPQARPRMSEVYNMLCGQSEILNTPAKPMTIGMLSPPVHFPHANTSTTFSSSIMASQPSVYSTYSHDKDPTSQVEPR